MSDIDVSKSQVSCDSKKRKAKEAGDVHSERRKKRKRMPHSTKKNKGKNIPYILSSVPYIDLIDSEEMTMMSTDRIKDDNASTGKASQSNDQNISLSKEESHVDVNDSNTQNKEKVGKKKAKKERSLPDLDSVSNPPLGKVEPEKTPDKKPKEKKKESKYPDPRKDSSLSGSETALKALSFVYERLTSHSEWKFNKARQNWIIRNIWDENAIPEVYVPSCVKYLKGVQGNSRNVLIKECNSIIEEYSKNEPAKPEGTVHFEEPSEPKVQNEIKYSRAQAILKKLT